jgi:hypothetical protein
MQHLQATLRRKGATEDSSKITRARISPNEVTANSALIPLWSRIKTILGISLKNISNRSKCALHPRLRKEMLRQKDFPRSVAFQKVLMETIASFVTR